MIHVTCDLKKYVLGVLRDLEHVANVIKSSTFLVKYSQQGLQCPSTICDNRSIELC